MKVLVCVKRVVDYNVKVRVKPDGSGPDIAAVKMSMNPFDEIAVEQGVRLKEAKVADEVVALSVGVAKCADTLRTAMAIGADRSILVKTDEALEPLAVARTIAAVAAREKPDLILMGKQAIDDDAAQVGPMVAALLGAAQGTCASELKVEGGKALIAREIDGGLERVALRLPAVVTADLRLNDPRYVTLPAMMKAKRKKMETVELASLGVQAAPSQTVGGWAAPAARKAGVKVASVAELLDKLRNEAKVL